MEEDELRLAFRNPAVPLSPGQLKLRQQVLEQVEKHPDTFNMSDWEYTDTTCSTTRCVAGWAQYLARGKVTFGAKDHRPERRGPQVELDAVGLLGLTEEEYYQRDHDGLFYTSDSWALPWLRELAEENAK